MSYVAAIIVYTFGDKYWLNSTHLLLGRLDVDPIGHTEIHALEDDEL